MVEPRSHEFRVTPSGPRLHFLSWGTAGRRPLVLLHGGGANAHWWDHIAPAFAAEFYVVAPDFRGHGDSERPEELVSGAFNEDLSSLLRQLGDPRAVLIGHSMGAHVALTHATRHPVPALILLDPARGGTQRNRRRLRLALSLRQSYESRDEAIARFRFLPDAEYADESLRRAIAGHSVEQGRDGRWRYKFDSRWFGLPPTAQPDPEQVTCPVLIVRGAESQVLSEEGAQQLARALHAGETRLIARAGHHVQIDQPREVIDCVSDFLSERVSAPNETTDDGGDV